MEKKLVLQGSTDASLQFIEIKYMHKLLLNTFEMTRAQQCSKKMMDKKVVSYLKSKNKILAYLKYLLSIKQLLQSLLGCLLQGYMIMESH
jgi:arginine deiminase